MHLSSSLQQLKKTGGNTWNNVSRQWTSGSRDEQTLKEQKQCDSYVCPRLLPGESIQNVASRGVTKTEPRGPPSWGHKVGCVGRPQRLKFAGQSTRKERAAQIKSSGNLLKISLEAPAECWSVPVWEETAQHQGKNDLKGLEGTILEIHIGLEIVCVAISQSGKTSKFMGCQAEYWEECYISRGENSS